MGLTIEGADRLYFLSLRQADEACFPQERRRVISRRLPAKFRLGSRGDAASLRRCAGCAADRRSGRCRGRLREKALAMARDPLRGGSGPTLSRSISSGKTGRRVEVEAVRLWIRNSSSSPHWRLGQSQSSNFGLDFPPLPVFPGKQVVRFRVAGDHHPLRVVPNRLALAHAKSNDPQ